MGLLPLKRLLVSTQPEWRRRRRRRQIQPCHGSSVSSGSASVPKRKKQLCQDQDDQVSTPRDKRLRYSVPDLPEEIWDDIHSLMHHKHLLMPMRDAARVACVSRAFLRSWRRHPNLTFTKDSLGFHGGDGAARGIDFIRRIDHILETHSFINVKTLTIDLSGFTDVNRAYLCRLDRWLTAAVAPGIEEITILLTMNESAAKKKKSKGTYKFHSSLLDGLQSSIRYLKLHGCAFKLTGGGGVGDHHHKTFVNLTTLHLLQVRITGHELGLLLHSTPALKLLNLHGCPDVDRLRIPEQLQQLSVLRVSDCDRLLVIDVSRAPNLVEFHLRTEHQLKRLLLGPKPLGLIKTVSLGSRQLVFCSASAMLLDSVPCLERLTIRLLCKEVAYYLMSENKFLHLKHLNVALPGWGVTLCCDYLALLPSLAACPSLETFFLNAIGSHKLPSILEEDSSPLGMMTMIKMKMMPAGAQRLEKLKHVEIKHFSSARNLVEMTCRIAENSPSLECLTLDTSDANHPRYSAVNVGRVFSMEEVVMVLMEAQRSKLAIRRYIQGKLPSTAKLDVLELSS